MKYILFFALFGLGLQSVFAVTGVNPSGVNVRTSGATSVFLTFQGLDPDEQVLEAFWCGELTQPGGPVFTFNPCVPGTILGRLPARFDRSTISGTGGRRNLTDIMTIPASVARKSHQAAQAGGSSQFFYVRRFSSGLFVVVTCRMAGGGARTPLALTNVRVGFQLGDQIEVNPIYTVARGAALPKFGAKINYNGGGRLRGRWEVALPGDAAPTTDDLLPAASLPVEQRPFQQRWALLERFDVFLTPRGEFFLPGPKFNPPPTNGGGLHRILLRIEASDASDSLSNTGGGLVASAGGTAGFPMPILRYFVGSSDEITGLRGGVRELSLLQPGANEFLPFQPVTFSWVESAGASYYRVEVRDKSETVVDAVVKPGALQYTAPPWLQERAGTPLRWRVVALARSGNELASSPWRNFQIEAN